MTCTPSLAHSILMRYDGWFAKTMKEWDEMGVLEDRRF